EATGYIVAQFLCELAEQELAEGRVNQARRTLKRALLADAGCARASLIEARVLLDAGEEREALRPLRRIERQDLAFMAEALPLLARAHTALGQQDEFERYLATLSGTPAGVPAALMLAELKAAREGTALALDCLGAELATRPSLRGVEQLLRYALPAVSVGPISALRQVQDQVHALVRKRHGYRCGRCGFRARTLHWLCPSCKRWNEIKPLQGNEHD
ncbi:MAG TPA: hypothetical protein DCY89_01990, partial [Gammaproteobacteria bacterium]|nr:hypothetical protein [Gammaproteobacteria bacterium]